MTKSQSSRHFIIFSLVGGVLLAAALSLIPQPVSALNSVIDSTNTSDSSNYFVFTVNLQQGCLTKFVSYDENSSVEVLNSNYSAYNYTGACGWVTSRDAESHNYYVRPYSLSDPSAFRRTYLSGSLNSYNNDIISQSQDHSTEDSFPTLNQTIKGLKVYIDRSPSSNTFVMPNTSYPDSRFLGHLSFNLPNNEVNSQWVSGFQPGFDKSSVRLQNLTNGSYMHETDPDKYYEYMTDISKSTYFVCGDSFDSSRWVAPIDPSNFPDTSTVCSVFFSFPNVPNYRYEFSDGFNFSTDVASLESLDGDSFVSANNLSVGDVSFMFRNTIAAGRTNPSSRYGSFMWSSNMFQIVSCSDQVECDYFNNLTENYRSSRNQTWQNPTSNPSSSVFDSWFNIFDFTFLFPFRSIFGMFDNSQCVEIPIIAGMLNTGSTYCTWWSPTVRSILTPVFSTFSLMLVTGFVFSWLTNGHAFTIDGTLARDSKNRAKGGK